MQNRVIIHKLHLRVMPHPWKEGYQLEATKDSFEIISDSGKSDETDHHNQKIQKLGNEIINDAVTTYSVGLIISIGKIRSQSCLVDTNLASDT